MPFDLCRIGQLLREAREKRGVTFEEVSNALFIRKRVVGAIEAGDWKSLPHPVYVKGYVTQYATFLEIADLLEREVAEGEDDSLAGGPDGAGKKRKWILKGWGLRKRKTQAIPAVSAPWSVIDQL